MTGTNINPFFLLMLGVPISMLVIPFAWKLAPRLGMVDKPDPRKVHSRPIPRIGGWGIVAGALLPIIVTLNVAPLLQSFIIGAVILFVFGLWDDAKQVSHWVKFAGQTLAAGAVVYHGGLFVSEWPFVGDLIPVAVSKCLTVVALMGMINAINHSDGLDGLAGGETMLSLIALAYLGYLASDDLIVSLSFATMGGIIGFLRYNTHPAQVFMGDSGSQFLGFSLGFFAIYITQIGMPAMSPALPLLFLGLPISDILVVLYKRAKGRMNWFKATRNHVHHRLLDLGFDHYETVVVIYSVQALLVTLAVLLRFQSDLLVSASYLVVVTTLFYLLTLAEGRGWKRDNWGHSRLTGTVDRLRANEAVKRLPSLLISVLLPVFLFAGAVFGREVPRDFGIVALVLGVIFGLETVLRREKESIVARLAMYVATVFSSYLFAHFGPTSGSYMHTTSLILIVVLASAVGLFIRYTSEYRFGATPTDYLIVFGVAALGVFGGYDGMVQASVQTIIYSVVLLYACEAIIGRAASRWTVIYFSTGLSLFVVAARGLKLLSP